MAVLDNTTKASDIEKALDVEFVASFNQEYDRLAEILGIFSPEIVAAGTAMYQYRVSGALENAGKDAAEWKKTTSYSKGDKVNVDGEIYVVKTAGTSGSTAPTWAKTGDITDGSTGSAVEWNYLSPAYATNVAEGDEVPLSKYAVEKTTIGAIEVNPYKRLTTAQAILKSGYENAILRTDKKMLQDIRVSILDRFFYFLANGTGSSTGQGLQLALAQAGATLEDAMEQAGDKADRIFYFVNRFDIANYLGTASVTTQNVFGMTYIESFLGVENIFVTSKVPQGTIYATPAENIHIYGVDFGALGQAGLNYTTYNNPLIGVNHNPAYGRVSAETNVLTGATMIAEITNYIVKGSVTA